MRKKLSGYNGIRKTFTAIFSKTGKKVNFKGYSEDTLLLVNVVDSATREMVCDHVWFTYSKTFEKVALKEGVKVSFEARVKEYTKGYVNKSLSINRRKTDYKLSHPTKVRIVTE